MKRTFGRSSLFWGIALIGAAILLVLDAVGKSLGIFELPLFKIIVCVLIGAWGVAEAVKGRPNRIFLPLGFIFVIMQKDIARWAGLGEDTKIIPVWVALVAALLLQIGATIIFPKKNRFRNTVRNAVRDHVSASSDTGSKEKSGHYEQGEDFFENDLGSSTCYIDAARLGTFRVENDLGNLDVFIENAELYTGGGVIEVQNDLGKTTVHIPQGWAVDNRVNASLGSVRCSVPSEGSPLITLIGSCDLGDVSIV